MKKSSAVASGLTLYLVVLLISRTDAWFVSYEDEASTTVRPKKYPKILESSKEHAISVIQELRKRSALGAAEAPPPVKQTTADPGPVIQRNYWPDLPDWLPAEVRAEFVKDNNRYLQRSASTPKPTAEIETRNYWDTLPDWLPAGVRKEFMRDNAEYMRRVGGQKAGVTATPMPSVEHVTRNYWNNLPDWIPAKVRAEFHSDNREFLRWRGIVARETPTTTPAPTVEVVTKDSWHSDLPTWLPSQVRRQFIDGNDGPIESKPSKPTSTRMSQPGAPAGAASEATLPPWLVELLSSTTTLQPTTVEMMQQSATPSHNSRPVKTDLDRDLAMTQSFPTPASAPTRPPLTFSSNMQRPPKCNRQINWIDQSKCSASRSKWTFNLVTLRCEWFSYYGCPLNNGNIFNSRRDCENYCIKGITNPCESSKCESVYSFYKSTCFLLNDTTCINRILKQYSYIGSPALRLQSAQEEITLFCQPPMARCLNTGINARMPSYESPPKEEQSDTPSHCNLTPDRGICQGSNRGKMSRVYYYSQQHNECKFMVNFGCGGNLNRFANLADCYNNCGV